MITPLLSLALLTAAQAASPDVPAVDEDRGAIVNGVIERDVTTTAALGFAQGQFRIAFCSASLIAPNLLLTAAHCSAELAKQYGFELEQLEQIGVAFFATNVSKAGDDRIVAFQKITNHPKYSSGDGASTPLNDVSVITLAANAPADVQPVWFATEGLDDAVGEEVLSVGYGVISSSPSDQQSSGTRRSARLIVSDIDDRFLYSRAAKNPKNANVCSGDSGGPQYKVREDGSLIQWAIHDFVLGPGDPCKVASGSTRTDSVSDFILKQIENEYGTTDRCAVWDIYGDGQCDSDCAQPDPDCEDDVCSYTGVTCEDGEGEECPPIDLDCEVPGDKDGDGIPDKGCKKGCAQTGGSNPVGVLGLAFGMLWIRRRR